MSQNSENHIIATRYQKLGNLREAGFNFPNHYKPNSRVEAIQLEFDDQETIEDERIFSIAGRIMSKRVVGKISFCQIQDSTGKLQIFVKRQILGDEAYKEFKKLDVGDIVYAQGQVARTQTGELSIEPTEVVLLTKNLYPLPEKFHGLTDTEQRYRQRYLDLMNNRDVQKSFILRSNLIKSIRHMFEDNSFMEVETPMLQAIPGGANAKPFVTHYNALDHDFYLRIAPELYLKRLIVGGFDKVYEINRNFRNEGVSTRHNPEFTMLEFYETYATYEDHIQFIGTMLGELAKQVNKSDSTVINYQGQDIDMSQYLVATIEDLILEHTEGLTKEDLQSGHKVMNWCLKNNIPNVGEPLDLGKLIFSIFEEFVEDKLINPTFAINHPTSVSPLARPNDDNPAVVDRFELYIGGREIANGFSELNDAEDQAARMKEQAEGKDAGDEESMYYDDDYIKALEYGMPPTAGAGIGIDRLMMLFMDAGSIRDSVLFPQLKPLS